MAVTCSQVFFFMLTMLVDTTDFYRSILLSVWPWLVVRRSAKSQTCWLHFCTCISTNHGVETVQLEHPDTTFWVRFLELREIIPVLLTGSNNFGTGMHSDIYELIWFKLGLVIDTAELCMMTLGLVILTIIQGHRDAREQKLLCHSSYLTKIIDMIEKNFCAHFLTNFSIDMDEV